MMKILLIEWKSFARADLKEALTLEGHELVLFPISVTGENLSHNPELEERLSAVLHKEAPDLVFSVDYWPAVSIVCNREKVRYISWTYDNPHVMLYSHTVTYPCNIIFVFDQTLWRQFYEAGIRTVHYMPLAANTERLDAIAAVMSSAPQFAYDVSFVGSLYLEKENHFDQMMAGLSEYTKGYLNALMEAQMKIQGYNFIEEALHPVIEELHRVYPIHGNEGGMETREYLYAQYIVNRRITGIERIDLLDAVAQRKTVDLFTHYRDFALPNLRNHGNVDYDTEMPNVFRCSKINLNISLRSIQSGIPLRAFDIMGSGGFLLSNFQADYLEHFVPGEDFVFYESKEDLVRKVEYYLNHEEERQAIARNGHDKIAREHTYRHRVREMLSMCP